MEDDRDDRLKRVVLDHYRSTPVPSADLLARILRGLDDHDAASGRFAILRWWWRPAALRLAPAATLAAACLLVAAGAWIGGTVRMPTWRSPDRGTHAAAQIASVSGNTTFAASEAPAREVAFMLVAPGVTRVSLVGEFNDWDPLATPLIKVGPDGPWVTTVRLMPGRHVYGFVLDGARWVSDPGAPLAPDDGFGGPNSVLVVGQEGRL